MITWILASLLIVWCIIKRFGKDGKIEGQPLGMPRGSVRALITLLIITFPFIYLIRGEAIPRLIINAIFILVAFYFQARKSSSDKLKRIIEEAKNPEKFKEGKKKVKKHHPLYLPRYSVRILLVTILTVIFIINTIGPNVPFESTTTTLFDLLIIICLFMIGGIFRSIMNSRERKKIIHKIENMKDYLSLSIYEIHENLMVLKPGWWKRKRDSVLSLLTLTSVIIALLCFTIEWDYIIFTLPFYEFTLREILLLLINVYYGWRE